MINTLRKQFPELIIGYSGHEVGLATTLAAVTLGAKVIERHITLSRAMWGTDQSASIEMAGMTKLVKDIRTIESSLGDGIKKVYSSEQTPSKIKTQEYFIKTMGEQISEDLERISLKFIDYKSIEEIVQNINDKTALVNILSYISKLILYL